MLNKTVGIFKGKITDPYPSICTILDSRGNELKFNIEHVEDLEYLVSQMKKYQPQSTTET
jgi:hypothetical protein